MWSFEQRAELRITLHISFLNDIFDFKLPLQNCVADRYYLPPRIHFTYIQSSFWVTFTKVYESINHTPDVVYISRPQFSNFAYSVEEICNISISQSIYLIVTTIQKNQKYILNRIKRCRFLERCCKWVFCWREYLPSNAFVTSVCGSTNLPPARLTRSTSPTQSK